MNWWVQLSKAVLREGPGALMKWEGVSSKEIETGFLCTDEASGLVGRAGI
tara:strand:+ start:117 stop:266 length:150 start_codon:yes stop_codon:yes gene_type:complete